MKDKLLITLLIVIAVACSCKGNKKIYTHVIAEKVAVVHSINKTNAYNDLFLDSANVEQFIVAEKLNDTLANFIRGFYMTRNFEYAWFAGSGLIEQSYSFHSLYATDDDSDLFNKALENRLDILRRGKDTIAHANDPETIKTELQITQRFIEYAITNYKTVPITPEFLATFIPAKKIAIADRVAALIDNAGNKNSFSALSAPYRDMLGMLKKYSVIAKNGGWAKLEPTAKKYLPGATDTFIALIKKRLQISGELHTNDVSGLFDSSLAESVKIYQGLHGLKQNGVINTELINDLNMPVQYRMQQIIINMQRLRWMPAKQTGRIIIVNIPEFEVYLDSSNTTLFQMDAVVGAEAHHTSMFSGKMNQIVFSPYWNVPMSIVKKEVIPGMRRDKNYLQKRDMEITGHIGDLPVVRQKPGAKNALGKVKFLFPNSFSIYLHDSPEKGLFNRNERDLSHGCIRLSNAPKLAYYLLRDNAAWPVEKIDSAMNSGHEQYVKLKDPVPVIITYLTTWIDHAGVLHFADDIYGHDKQMAQKMFTDPQ